MNNSVHGVIKALTYYLIGGYIRRYFDYELKKYLLVIFGITITLLLHCVIMYYSYFSNHIFIKILGSFMYNIFVCPVMVMTIFIFFKNIFILKERNVDFINLIADTTFGIYLLHDSPFVRPLLWSKVIPAIDLYKSNIFPLYALVSILVVFAFSSVFNILYKYILEKRVISIVDNCVVYIKKW